MSQISTHILNTSEGIPADGVKIFLYKSEDRGWRKISEGITDKDGRVNDLTVNEIITEPAIYKMEFQTGEYFKKRNETYFYPYVEIIFDLKDRQHYHIPLLLGRYGYTTYRGS